MSTTVLDRHHSRAATAAAHSSPRAADCVLRSGLNPPTVFCDCAGLNALLAARGQCRDAGVGFLVSEPVTPAVQRLLELTDTGSVLLAKAA
jgi:hypothetical protein